MVENFRIFQKFTIVDHDKKTVTVNEMIVLSLHLHPGDASGWSPTPTFQVPHPPLAAGGD
jgi:hypothetical protein